MQGAVQPILLEGTVRQNMMERSGFTENNRVINFESATSMTDEFIDVEIMDVYPNSRRGVLLRTEDQIALRSHKSPGNSHCPKP